MKDQPDYSEIWMCKDNGRIFLVYYCRMLNNDTLYEVVEREDGVMWWDPNLQILKRAKRHLIKIGDL